MKSCGAYRGVKLLEHAMKIVERVLEKRIRNLVEVDSDAIWLHARERNNRCCVHLEEVARGISR